MYTQHEKYSCSNVSTEPWTPPKTLASVSQTVVWIPLMVCKLLQVGLRLLCGSRAINQHLITIIISDYKNVVIEKNKKLCFQL